MRFKELYLEEKLKQRDITDLKNKISGIAAKEISGEEERDGCLYFQLSPLGAWSLFKKNLLEELKGSYSNQSKDSTNLKFVDGKITLFVKYANNTAQFCFSDKKIDEPLWTAKTSAPTAGSGAPSTGGSAKPAETPEKEEPTK